MSLEFLEVDRGAQRGGRLPVARSPMERDARAAGARFEVRDGWNVAVAYDRADGAARGAVGWTDVSHLGKLEVQAPRAELASIVADCTGGARLEPGAAVRAAGAWWCAIWPEKVLVLGNAPALRPQLEAAASGAKGPVSVVDLTCAFAALTVVGPQARETFARFTALDLRPASMPVGGFRPGSVARSPGFVLREGEDRFLMLMGAALGQYAWTQVADAGRHLGGGPVGADELPPLDGAREEEVGAHA